MRFLPLSCAVALAACSFGQSEPRYDTGLDELDIESVQPAVLVPGTVLSVQGRSFVDAPWGATELVLAGRLRDAGGDRAIEVRLPARFVDVEHVEVEVTGELAARLGSWPGDLDGTAVVAVKSAVDHEVHETRALPVRLSMRPQLTPALEDLDRPSVVFVNDEIEVTGGDLLLGGDEGVTVARVEGCFARELDGAPGACAPVAPVEVPVAPASRFDRTRGRFRFAPEIAGIRAGEFRGQVTLRNRHGALAGGAVRESAPLDTAARLAEAEVRAVSPDRVSLGQYLDIEGRGFVGGAPGQVTLMHLTGRLQKDDADDPVEIDTFLVPEFVSGGSVRYVMNEDDDLGRMLRLRGAASSFAGRIAPVVSFGDDELTGAATDVDLRLSTVVQVVYIRFTSQYAGSLRSFGLRAADEQIRRRVVEVVERDYRTINVDVRTEAPADFALYAEVEVGGPDPNGLGLLGYDNTPGKDVGNLRLDDRIGGVNAMTQADGYPGYGGVFVESLFAFSDHPNGLARESGGDTRFDDIFDPFRPDLDGQPLSAEEADAAAPLASSASCPSSDRAGRVECAVWVLGSLVGTTVSHELAHSLGLANPSGGDVHILTDEPNRLMEMGSGRDFRERAELDGEGPGMFCVQEYAYLRDILPRDEIADATARPGCR